MKENMKHLLTMLTVAAIVIPLTAISPALADGGITATDPEGDVSMVSLSGTIPQEYIPKIDIVEASLTTKGSSARLTITFVSEPLTVEDLPTGYSLLLQAQIRGTVNGKTGVLAIMYGNMTYNTYGVSVGAIISSDDGSINIFIMPSMGGDITASASGNQLIINLDAPGASFIPSLGNASTPSQIEVVLHKGDISSGTYAFDTVNFYEQGTTGGGGGTITSPTTTTTTTTTTVTTTTPYEEVSPLEEQPTTDAVTVSLDPLSQSRVTVDTTHSIVEVEVSGTGATSGQAPDHVGVGFLYYMKDGNYSYDMFNGDGEWDGDGPENGYVFVQSFMGYEISIRVEPTGPPENPWATFSYRFYAKVPMDYMSVFYGLSQLDRAYVYARAYLDEDETLWNQAYVQAPISSGTGELTTTTTQTQATTTPHATTTTPAGGETTTGSGEASGGVGINPLIIAGVIAAIAVAGAAVFILKK